MLFEVRSSKSLEEIGRGLEAAAARHKFGVIGVHDLKQKMREKGVEFAKDCMIYEVCNPQQAKKVLEANPAISTALPCRISVYGESGGYKLSTMLPTALLRMFGTRELDEVAHEVEEVVVAMMKESA